MFFFLSHRKWKTLSLNAINKMHDTTLTLPVRSRIPAKSVALPVEHGAWGFLFEPLLAGLLIAPTVGGGFLSVMIVGAFLCRQPLKFVLGDLKSGKQLPRTSVAIRWLFYFAAIAAVGLVGSIFTAEYRSFIPLVIAAPAALYLIWQDASRKSREMVPELLAAAALSATIASLTLAAGATYVFATAMWLTMTARLIPSVIYVRNRLRLEKKKDYSKAASLAAHVAAAAVLVGLYLVGLGSILTIVVAGFLLMRSVSGLSSSRKQMTAKQLGVREVIYGVIYALSVVLGYYLSV